MALPATMHRTWSSPALAAGSAVAPADTSGLSAAVAAVAAASIARNAHSYGAGPFCFRQLGPTTGTHSPREEAGSEAPLHLRPSLERALRHVQALPPQTEGAPLLPSASRTGAPPVRGRQAVFERTKHLGFGVSGPRCWSVQLEDCEAECKLDFAANVSACRSLGQKFTDMDFPPSKRSLYVHGGRPSSSHRMPSEVTWRRAGEILGGDAAGAMEISDDSQMSPGAIDDTAFLGAAALLRAAQRTPDDLIVEHDLNVGIVGVRLFKDGAWTYEIIDDHLPCCNGVMACGLTSSKREVWLALLEKANAKIHGSYEAVQRSTELETLEDITSGAVRKLERREMSTGTGLMHHLEHRQRRLGCFHLAVRRRDRRGEAHSCGLLAGYGYPIFEVELGREGSRACCWLYDPWTRGGYHGSGGAQGSRTKAKGNYQSSFLMDADEMLKYFTEVLEVRIPNPHWPCYQVTLSTDRPSYPLLSSCGHAQCMVVACQRDRRWNRQDSYLNGLGLRVYRCRVQVPPSDRKGARQNPNSNPFEPLELIRWRPLGKTRSACLDFDLEPYALYVVVADSQYRCPFCFLRFACSSDVQFRELSAPEAEHFLAAQTALGNVGLPRSTSEGSMESVDGAGEEICNVRRMADQCSGGDSRASWWSSLFGCS